MHHRHKVSGGRGHKVDLLVRSRQVFLQYSHREHTGPGGHISRADSNAVGGGHPGSRISFRRAQRDSCFQISIWIQKFCPLFCQAARILPRKEHLGQKLPDLPGKALVCHQFIKLIQHPCIVVFRPDIDREHAGGVSAAQHFLPGQFPVDIPCKCCEETHFIHMFLAV